MAKFCEKCGKPLVDGNCENCSSSAVETITTTKTSNNGGFDFSKLVSMLKDTFTRPIDLIKEESHENNFGLAWILLAISAVSMGLFFMALCKTLYSSFISMIGLGSMYSSLSSMTGYNVEIPYFRIFIVAAIVYVVMALLFSGLITLFFGKVFKGNITFKKAFTMYQVAGIIMIVGYLAGAILSLVSFPIGFIVFLVTSVLNFVYLICGLSQVSGVNKNLIGYSYLSVMASAYLILFIFSKLFS